MQVRNLFLHVDALRSEFLLALPAEQIRELIVDMRKTSSFFARTLLQSWLVVFLDQESITVNQATLALEVINALDHPNKHHERPYADSVHADLARRFVAKIEDSKLDCLGLEQLKLRCGLMGRDPVIAKYE